MNKKAIIFGVTGQDGSYLADLLLEKDYRVVGVSRRTSTCNTGRLDNAIRAGLKLEQGDVTDVFSIMEILRKHEDVEEIYNLSAQSHVGVSFKQPAITWDITGKGCLNVLQGMVDLDIDARFYQASSSEMFGKNYDTNYIVLDDDKELMDGIAHKFSEFKYQNEDTRFLPQSPYAIAKCAAHYMTRLFREAYGVHASAGILFNHESPRRGKDFVTRKITKWIGEFRGWLDSHNLGVEDVSTSCRDGDIIFASGVSGSFPKLRLGNLDASRDWGFAGDYVKAMWMMLQKPYPDDYVICTGQTHTIKDFLDTAFKHTSLGSWHNFVVIDMDFYRPAEVDYLLGDNSKAKKKLGWEPDHTFEDLVKIMCDHDVACSLERSQ